LCSHEFGLVALWGMLLDEVWEEEQLEDDEDNE
jgi:hypothetical protein